MGDLVGLTAIIGGLVLAAVLVWVVIRNSQRSKGAVQRTEEATRDLRVQMDREDKISDPDPARN